MPVKQSRFHTADIHFLRKSQLGVVTVPIPSLWAPTPLGFPRHARKMSRKGWESWLCHHAGHRNLRQCPGDGRERTQRLWPGRAIPWRWRHEAMWRILLPSATDSEAAPGTKEGLQNYLVLNHFF